MDDIGQQIVPSLTPELWSNVFAHVEELPENFGNHQQDQRRNQAEVHQLKLVCKQFRDIYASHSGLVQRLYLGFSSERSLPSLIAWLQQNKSSIQTFQSEEEGNSLVDVVLSLLVSSETSMRMVNVFDVGVCSIPLIATFSSLEKVISGKQTDRTWNTLN